MLSVVGVSKTYEPPPRWLRPLVRSAVREPFEALRDISLEVRPGEVVGLIGLNGAGKTSLLKIISTLLWPTSGTVTLDGHDTVTAPSEVCRRLGLVLEGDQGLYDRLTGAQNLVFYGMLAGLARPHAQRRAAELLEMLQLAQRDKLVFGYSAGMRMRLSIARSLLADPALVVLDEPTRSLDPAASRFTGTLLRELAGQGKAVLMSNHRMDEVAGVCDRVVAIVDGRVRFEGRPSDMSDTSAGSAQALSDLLGDEAPR